jgi:hypothetical protein
MLFNFIKAKGNPSEENKNALLDSIPGAKKIAEASPAAQATSNTTSPISRRRARSLEKQSQLNNKTTLLGG